MKTTVCEENYVQIHKELAPKIAGAVGYWHRVFIRNNIKMTPPEVQSMTDEFLLRAIRKFKTGKWEGTTTKCKFESYAWTYINCMMSCFLTKCCGLYSTTKDGKKKVKNRSRIPEQYYTSLSGTLLQKLEGVQSDKEGTERIQIIKSQDRDPAEIMEAKDVVEQLLRQKPKYAELLGILQATESIEDTASELNLTVQAIYAKLGRIQKYITQLFQGVPVIKKI